MSSWGNDTSVKMVVANNLYHNSCGPKKEWGTIPDQTKETRLTEKQLTEWWWRVAVKTPSVQHHSAHGWYDVCMKCRLYLRASGSGRRPQRRMARLQISGHYVYPAVRSDLTPALHFCPRATAAGSLH